MASFINISLSSLHPDLSTVKISKTTQDPKRFVTQTSVKTGTKNSHRGKVVVVIIPPNRIAQTRICPRK